MLMTEISVLITDVFNIKHHDRAVLHPQGKQKTGLF